MSDVRSMTEEEAVEALTNASWVGGEGARNYKAAVDAVLALAEVTPESDRSILASEIRATVKEALGPDCRLIHCFLGGLGADWGLESAIALVRRGDVSRAWVPDILGHELAIFADGKTYRFEVRRPFPVAASA